MGLTNLTTLSEFLDGKGRFTGEIINHPAFDYLYCRFWKHIGKFTIANITANHPGKGSFTSLLGLLESREDVKSIVVESVLTERFKVKLLALGFTPVEHQGYTYERATRRHLQQPEGKV